MIRDLLPLPYCLLAIAYERIRLGWELAAMNILFTSAFECHLRLQQHSTNSEEDSSLNKPI